LNRTVVSVAVDTAASSLVRVLSAIDMVRLSSGVDPSLVDRSLVDRSLALPWRSLSIYKRTPQ
jgi:hypothetical protein